MTSHPFTRWLACLLLTACLLIGTGCGNRDGDTHHPRRPKPAPAADPLPLPAQPLPPAKSRLARHMDSMGLVNIAEADPRIAISLMYTRADNFTGQLLYKELREAYLHPEAMQSLSQAQDTLQRLHPGYRLIVYDAARPLSVQQEMWNVVRGTRLWPYVSNPARGGGLHNYGLAVDIGLLDSLGQVLPMGTPVDHLGPEAHTDRETQLLAEGKLTADELANRRLLRHVMRAAGFRVLPTEWWHFNRYSREVAKARYKVIP